MPILWGRYFTEEETRQLACELNNIGTDIERKTRGVAEWVRDVEERRMSDPHGRIF